MKHLKLYEMIEDEPREPQLGDYVVFGDESFSIYNHSEASIKFMKNNIGKIVETDMDKDHKMHIYYYLIQYEKILKPPAKDFFIQDGHHNTRWIKKNEIGYFSSNKKDCETYLAAKKYNL